MEKKLDEENKITFIDRKKAKPFYHNLKDTFTNYMLFKVYKEENVIFKILYDKLYRPDLFNLIIRGSMNNLNLTRNLFRMNNTKFKYDQIVNNDKMNFTDDDLYSENSYLFQIYNIFLVSKITLYLSIPFGLGSVYFILNRSYSKANIFFISCLMLLCVNLRNANKKEKIIKSSLYRSIEETNRSNIEIYKKFYADL